MSDNTSVIDAVRLIAKATKDDPTKLSDIVKGALHPDQIDDMRLMLSRARDGSVVHGAATTSAAASAPAASAAAGPRDKAESSLTAASEFPPLSATTTTWSVRTVNRAPSRPRASRRAETPHPTIFATDAEVAAMTPREKALHETQVSRPTLREEATTGGSSSSATAQEPFLAPWRPEQLPLTRNSGLLRRG